MEGQRVAQLKRLLRNDRVQVKRIAVAAHEKKADSVYVFFGYAEEEKVRDKTALTQLKAEAEEVAKDKVYQKLSNSKQRELFLLDHYNLSKKESGDMIELVKMIEIGAQAIEKAEEKKEEGKER
jgi:hypothetical protein